jgi:hypothetical protein
MLNVSALSERVVKKVKTDKSSVLSSDIVRATFAIAGLYCSLFWIQYNPILTEFLKNYHPMFKN